MPIKVAITDDHPMVLQGLKNALLSQPGFLITGSYTNGGDLLDALAMETPDVLLLDLQLPEMSGSKIAKEVLLHHPEIKILVLSGSEELDHIENMIAIGCSGYLLKSNTDHTLLLRAIEQVYYGEIFLESSLERNDITDVLKAKTKKAKITNLLTNKEKEVMALIVKGFSNREIAEKLKVSSRTVETHRSSIMQKLEVKNAAELVRKTLELHLTD
jgi:DNA-binding NarL/FixJ family response regulator